MHSVPAKVAQEIRVLFEHDHFDACARQQKAQHYSGGPAARDTAIRADLHEAYLSRESRKVNRNSARQNY
jgi:hypothetical protein